MAEIFNDKFHRYYVRGQGEVADKGEVVLDLGQGFGGLSYDDILAQYRSYVMDPEAELPQEIIDQLAMVGKI